MRIAVVIAVLAASGLGGTGIRMSDQPPSFAVSYMETVESKVDFSVKVRDFVISYRVFGLFVLPDDVLEFEVRSTASGSFVVETGSSVGLERIDTRKWRLSAPDAPGVYSVTISRAGDTMRLNLFVKTPFDNMNPIIRGYRIGAYQSRPWRGNPRYRVPDGFVEVNQQTAGAAVSPNLKLGQFACHQPGNPKFVALDERLLLKLEMLLEQVNRRGIPARSFVIMSGYRTPWYNASIGNKTKYSSHLYGRAADIYIDEDGDGRMDDLNQDGAVDLKDARLLYELIDEIKTEPWYQSFLGGLGLYGPKPEHGPFVHVDARGYVARW